MKRLAIVSLTSAAAGVTAVSAASRPAAPSTVERAPLCAVIAERAVIGNTRGKGAFLRATPSFEGDKQALPEGTTVRLTGRTQAAEQIAWSEVEALGRSGWVATRYLIDAK